MAVAVCLARAEAFLAVAAFGLSLGSFPSCGSDRSQTIRVTRSIVVELQAGRSIGPSGRTATCHGSVLPPDERTSLTSSVTSSRTFLVSFSITIGTRRSSPQRA